MADEPCLPPQPRPRRSAPATAHPPGIRKADAARRARLVTFSRPAMECLHQQLESPGLAVVLADNDGSILNMVGARALWWRPPHRAVQGVAAPILTHGGGVLGILDFATSPHADFGHANALLRTTAAIIEHRLIDSDVHGFLVLRFHPRPGALGSPLEAVVVFDRDSRLLTGNQVASGLLAIDRRSSRVCCPDCFDTHWAGLVDRASDATPQAFMLRAQRGGEFFARASLRRALP